MDPIKHTAWSQRLGQGAVRLHHDAERPPPSWKALRESLCNGLGLIFKGKEHRVSAE